MGPGAGRNTWSTAGSKKTASHDAVIAQPAQIPVRPHPTPPNDAPVTSAVVPNAMILAAWESRPWARRIET